jgi:hypothetical protein
MSTNPETVLALAPVALPRDWAAKKKTSDAMLSLGVAIAWHNRLAADDGSVADDGSCGGWTGVVVDPTGNDTQPMTEQQYDDMIKSAVEQLRKCRADAAQGTAKLVRVLQHPSALHACIVALPSALDARKYVHDVRNAPDGTDPLDTQAFMFSKRLVWPLPAQLEADFYVSYQLVYPNSFLGLLGWKGVEVKERA